MRRRSRAGGEHTKAQRRKTGARKSRVTPKGVRGSSAVGHETEIARLSRERDEALARQTATSEILRVISQSPTDVRPVFDSIVLTAARLLRCDLVLVLLCDGGTFSHAAVASPEGLFVDQGPTIFPIDPSANFPSRAIVAEKCCIYQIGHLSTYQSTNGKSVRDSARIRRFTCRCFAVESVSACSRWSENDPMLSTPLKSLRPNPSVTRR